MNKYARRLRLDQLPVGQVAVVGGIRLLGAGEDFKYMISSATATTFIFVVFPPDPLAPYGTWKLYKSDGTYAGHSGKIVYCVHDNMDTHNVDASFLTCDGARVIMEKARKFHRTFDEILTLATQFMADPATHQSMIAAESAGIRGVGDPAITSLVTRSAVAATATRLSIEPAQLLELTAALVAVRFDSWTDPYWFSCGPGCCTAVM